MINGLSSTMDTWSPTLLSILAEQFRVIIFDNRGTGYSSASEEEFSIGLFAEDTVALMDSLGVSSAHIMGLSMGASIAQELVLTYPKRVSRLILVAGTCGGNAGIPTQPEVRETLSDKHGEVIDIANRMFSLLFPKEWLLSHDPWDYCPQVQEKTSEENAARQAEAFFHWPGSWDRLPSIRSPAFVITGTEDIVIHPDNSRILAGRIPNARILEVPSAGHGLQYQCPTMLGHKIVGFLKEPS